MGRRARTAQAMEGGQHCEWQLRVKNTFLEVAPPSPGGQAGAGMRGRAGSMPSLGAADRRGAAGGQPGGPTRVGAPLASGAGGPAGHGKARLLAGVGAAPPAAGAAPFGQPRRPQHQDEDHGWSCRSARQPRRSRAAHSPPLSGGAACGQQDAAGPTQRAAPAAAPAQPLRQPGRPLDSALSLGGARLQLLHGRPRPCKGKRERLRRLLARIESAIEADPAGFEFARVALPPSIANDAELEGAIRACAERYSGLVASAHAAPCSGHAAAVRAPEPGE